MIRTSHLKSDDAYADWLKELIKADAIENPDKPRIIGIHCLSIPKSEVTRVVEFEKD